MLKGKLRYKDSKFDVTFDVYAKDTGGLNLYLCKDGDTSDSKSYEEFRSMMCLMDSTANLEDDETEVYTDPTLYGTEYRRLIISESNAFKTNLQNMLLASRIATLIRYSYEYCNRRGKEEEECGADRVYDNKMYFDVIDCNDANVSLGYFVKDTGYLSEMHIKNKFIELDLVEMASKDINTQYFTPLKQKDNYGNILSPTKIRNLTFKFTKGLLGFDYVAKVKSINVATGIMGMYDTMDAVIQAHPDKNFKWILGRKYEIVTDETLDAVMAEFNAYDGVAAIDTETSGLNITFKSRSGDGDQLVGICLSKEEGTGYYFPLQMRRIPNLCGGDHNYFMQKYMKNYLETHKFITHNLSFDWKVFYIYDINLNAVFDTMLAFCVTKRYELANFEYGLKKLVKNIFGLDQIELSDFVYGAKWGTSDIRFWDLPYELCRQYAPTDADMTFMLYNWVIKNQLLEQYKAQAVFEIELKFAKVVSYSEFYGLHIATEKLPALIKDIEDGLDTTRNKLFDMAGETFNPNSTKDLVRIMFGKMGVPDVSGKQSTAKEFLKELASLEDTDGNARYPFAKTLKTYRDFEATYKNFLKRRAEFISPDGYVHAGVLPFGTNTGRVSVKDPNYQSYSDVVKKYVAPRKGFRQWDSDFSQIEYRVLCSMAHEPALIEAFKDPDMDYHTYQAARMFSVPYGAVTKQMRQNSKGINFGLPYGMGDSSLGARIFGKRTRENTVKAAELRERYFQGQDNIRAFFDTVRDDGVRNGYTRTLFGRLRYYHRESFSEKEIRRQAGNHVIQGTAADIFKIACNRMFDVIVAKNWLGKVLLDAFVHDEILGEVSEEINFYEFVEEWRKAFQVPIEGFCKLYAGLGIGNSWYEAKKADWTPQFIDEIINSPRREHWTGDGEEFIKWSKTAFYNYELNRVVTAIKENIATRDTLAEADKIIKPIIDAYLKDKLNDYLKTTEDVTGIATTLAISESEATSLIETARAGKGYNLDLQDKLKVFCYWQGLDYDACDIKAASDVEVAPTVNSTATRHDVEIADMSMDDFTANIVRSFGFMLDPATSRLVLNFNMLNATNTANKFIEMFGKPSGTYRVYGMVYNPDNSYQLVETNVYVTSADTLSMQIFLQSVVKSVSC